MRSECAGELASSPWRDGQNEGERSRARWGWRSRGGRSGTNRTPRDRYRFQPAVCGINPRAIGKSELPAPTPQSTSNELAPATG